MIKLRAPTRRPIVCNPVWPNAGVQAWYQLRLDALVDVAARELLHMLAAVWNRTPPLFVNDAAMVQADAAGVMFYCGARVLLTHRTDGQDWAFPGGTIEPNETAEAAARREVFEETLHPCNGLLEHISTWSPRGSAFRFATFSCEAPEIFKPTLNREHDDYAWMRPEDAIELLDLHPGARVTLEQFADVLAQDAPSPTKALQAMLAKWGAQTIKRFDLAAQDIAVSFTGRNTQATQTGMMGQLRAAGFTVQFTPTQRSIEAFRVVAAENVALIKSIPRKWHEQVEQKVWNAVRNGSDLSKLSIELSQTYGSTVKRAALIARDQNAKAKATIERVRQMELGITRGVWMHSHAGKEPRPTHVAMNDKPYELAQGMWDSDEREFVHPGELINCRCTTRPVIEGAEDYAEAIDQPTNIALSAALRNAQKYEGKARAAEMIGELKALRYARTSWAGADEMALRYEIDKLLRGEA